MSGTKRFISSVVSIFLFISIHTPAHASELDSCGLGKTLEYNENGDEVCTPMYWTIDSSYDTFDTTLFSYLAADSTDSPDVYELSVELSCRNSKNFNVYVWGDDDLYAWTNNRGVGTALMTFDLPIKGPMTVRKYIFFSPNWWLNLSIKQNGDLI